jgi:4-hydroxy-3-polyprenylbenzoate decarboxylase
MRRNFTDETRRAALGDLRLFLETAEAAGDVELVRGADLVEEMGALYELSLQHEIPPVMMFEDIKGYPKDRRVVVNVRSAGMFVVGEGMDRVRAFRASRKTGSEPIPPRVVNDGPVFENSQRGPQVDVLSFPAPKWHEADGGRYIGTECMVIVKDPDSDWVNVGTYRCQVHDRATISVFMEPGKHGDAIRRKYWANGKPCPMAICVGQAPVLGTLAATTLPAGVSEYAVAGARIGRPIDVVLGPETGLPIPADGEIVFEGVMHPPDVEARPEGPFGEWPGYYASGTRPEPVLKVAAIHHRNNPIMVGMPPAKPTLPGTYYGTAGTSLMRAATLWDDLEAAGVPGVTGVWKLPGGGSRFIDVVAIKQLHPGHAKMAGLVATGCGSAAFLGRMTIIVDDDIDITDPAEVMWALATRWDPKTQTDVIDGCWSGNLDPTLPPDKRAAGVTTNSRMIVYAVRPYHWKDEFPKVNTVSKEYADEVRRKWKGKLAFLD